MYYFGIVDFLQDWTFNKRVERSAKIYVMRKDPAGLSVMEPIGYKLRFQKKMRQIFDMDNSRQLGSPTSSLRPNAIAIAAPASSSTPTSTAAAVAKISQDNTPSVAPTSTQVPAAFSSTQGALTQPAESDNLDEEDTEDVFDTDL